MPDVTSTARKGMLATDAHQLAKDRGLSKCFLGAPERWEPLLLLSSSLLLSSFTTEHLEHGATCLFHGTVSNSPAT